MITRKGERGTRNSKASSFTTGPAHLFRVSRSAFRVLMEVRAP